MVIGAAPFFPEKFEYVLKDDEGVWKQYGIIQKLYKRDDLDGVINAGDPDREGSVIILNIMHELEKDTGLHKPVERVWLKAGVFYPVGRVLVPIVKYVYDRDMGIENFKKEIYYEIGALIKKDGMEMKSKIKDLRFGADQKAEGEKICKDLFIKMEVTSELDAVVRKVETKEVKKSSAKLFSLDKLQSKMSKDFKYSSAETLALTQSLYEKGYVMYPRTNTEYLATAEKQSVSELLDKLSAEEGIPLALKDSKTIFDDSKIEGHTALIITEKRPEGLQEKEQNVYQTIKNRFISNFFAGQTILEETAVEIGIGEYTVELKGTSILEEGFLKYEPINEKMLPRFTEDEKVNLKLDLVEKSTKPPAHVSESELNAFLKNPFRKNEIETSDDEDYKAMQQGCEIGTVATRAGIIENALRYEYIKKEKNALITAEKGKALIQVLEKLGINMDKSKTVEIGVNLKKVFRKETTLDNVIGKVKRDIAEIVEKGRDITV